MTMSVMLCLVDWGVRRRLRMFENVCASSTACHSRPTRCIKRVVLCMPVVLCMALSTNWLTWHICSTHESSSTNSLIVHLAWWQHAIMPQLTNSRHTYLCPESLIIHRLTHVTYIYESWVVSRVCVMCVCMMCMMCHIYVCVMMCHMYVCVMSYIHAWVMSYRYMSHVYMRESGAEAHPAIIHELTHVTNMYDSCMSHVT